MRKLLYTVLLSVILLPTNIYSQDIDTTEYDIAADSIYLKCLYEHKHFVSINALQFIVGTANINYEYKLGDRLSLRVGVGRILGYRILTNDHHIVETGANSISFGETTTGIHYFSVEPRYYTFESTMNCWMQVGVGVAYNFWDYQQKISTDKVNPITQETIYTYNNVKHHQVNVSLIGKHPVAGGFTFEYQIGAGAGSLDNKFYIAPNFGFLMGWTL